MIVGSIIRRTNYKFDMNMKLHINSWLAYDYNGSNRGTAKTQWKYVTYCNDW